MERYFVFLVVHDHFRQEDCKCLKDVFPILQNLTKSIHKLCVQDKIASEDLENSQYLSFDPILALKDAIPTSYFSVVVDGLFSDQLQFYSQWCNGNQLEELTSVLKELVSHNQNKNAEAGSSGEDDEISEKLHQLADDLPHAGVPVDVFWFICGKNNIPIRSHLSLFGALKRLQQWHNANIAVLCSRESDSRSSFSTTWQKGLRMSMEQLEGNDATLKLFNPRVVWQGSVVFSEDHSRIKLPGFNLCCERSKKNNTLHLKRQQDNSTETRNFELYIGPEIDILCKVQKHTVPFHMFVPVKLGLTLVCVSIKHSAHLVEWLSLEDNKNIALIGSIKLIPPTANCLKEKNTEAWFNFVSGQSFSGGTPDSKIEDDDTADYHRRICLICGGTERQLSLFVLRAAEHLNGKLQHDLTMVHSTLLISKDQEEGGPLKFPDLTDSFFETEQNLNEVLLCRLQQELSKCVDPCEVNPSPDLLNQLEAVKWKLIQEKREQLLQAGKELELEVVKRETLLQYKPALTSPSRWPERAWLIKNDQTANYGIRTDRILLANENITLNRLETPLNGATAGDTTQFPLLTSVSALSVQDILEKFRSDGHPVTRDLCPLQPRKESLSGRHVQVNTWRSLEDVKVESYPEALAASYHGIEYCLDDRKSIAKDSQLAQVQSSHVKLETLSSYVARDQTPMDSRPWRGTAKRTKNVEQKHNLMKLKVPLSKTKTMGKIGKSSVSGRLPEKRKSPLPRKPAAGSKRKREEPTMEETKPYRTKEEMKKETRSERHKRRLRQVVQNTLKDNGIDTDHTWYQACSDRLYSLCKSFLKDLRSSHGLNDEMKRLAKSNVQQVIEFETKRTSATQDT